MTLPSRHDKVRKGYHLPVEMAAEIAGEAKRLGCSETRIMVLAWTIACKQVMAAPAPEVKS